MTNDIKTVEFRGNIATTIGEFKAITAKRGYGVFDPPELSAQEKHVQQTDISSGRLAGESKAIRDAADTLHNRSTAAFLEAASDYKHPRHTEARKDFIQQFDGDPEKAKSHFRNAAYAKYGIGTAHVKNTAYEQKLLTPPQLNTRDEAQRHKGLCDLLKAKWDAVGYAGDKEMIQDFDTLYPGTIDYTRNSFHAAALPPRFNSTFLR